MRNTILSAIIGLATFTCMAATESQTQPEVGKPAPDFSLTTGDGSQVSLKDYRGKWVVLYFYPERFYQRLHHGGAQFPTRPREIW